MSDRFNALNPAYLGKTIISPQYLIDHTRHFQMHGRDTNDAFFDVSTRKPNYGGCEGGFPVDILAFIEQYGTATCDASDISKGDEQTTHNNTRFSSATHTQLETFGRLHSLHIRGDCIIRRDLYDH